MAKEPWKAKGGGEAASQPLTPAEPTPAAAPPESPVAAAPAPDPVQPPVPPVPPATAADGPKMLRMRRETPMFPGGPTEADVPESELMNWLREDWKVKE